jgi:hypothetical protein
MGRSVSRGLLFAIISLFVVSCGDQSLFMSLKGDAADIQVTSVTDGQLVAIGKSIPLTVAAQDAAKRRDLEMDVTLSSSSGASVWHDRRAVPALNAELAIELPELAPGQYRLDIVIYSAGEQVQKKSSTFFVVKDGWSIAGIKSFPALITTATSVLLKAELVSPKGADPWLRWTWKGKVLAKGNLASGLGQILWTAPADEGVYTIRLEAFPAAPAAGSDYPFASQLSLSTDIFVSAGKAMAKGNLGPEESYLSLLHMSGTLADTGTGARGRGAATALGTPEVVSGEDGFGYRLDQSSGISLPWLTLPIEKGLLKPFTISIGVSFADFAAGGNILSMGSSDGSLALSISLEPSARAPQARLTAGSATVLTFLMPGKALSQGQRYLLSLSIVPQGKNLTAQWFLDGLQVASAAVASPSTAFSGEGTTTIGGVKGFAGTVDEYGVFVKDAQGRPSPDTGLYAWAAERRFGSSLVMAEGFDGIYAPAGFELQKGAQLAAGTLVLTAGATVDLPPMALDRLPLDFQADLASGSVPAATLILRWEGDAGPGFEVTLPAKDGAVTFRLSASDQTLAFSSAGVKPAILPARPQPDTRLLARLGNPSDATSALIIEQILVLNDVQQ